MTTNYQIQGSDFDNYFIRRDAFPIGSFWLWGNNQFGTIGDNTSVSKSSPVQTVAGGINWMQISGGGYSSAAISSDGRLWNWGYNLQGQLGDNSIAYRSSPVQTVAGGTNWKIVATGSQHTAAIKTDGTLWSWGYNPRGQMGDNTIVNKSSPVQTVSGGATWKNVSAGTHTAAIKTDGTLWSWGSNIYGSLGDNTSTDRSSPVQTISGGTNWTFISCGIFHTVAIKTDGTLWSWGSNTYGELGDNTSVHRSSPIQTIAGGTDWKFIGAGVNITTAIKTDGTLWTWGRNSSGSLGDNTVVHRSSPVQTVAGGTNWKVSAGGQNFCLGIKTDGTLWAWGDNSSGQLGDNTVVSKSSPVQTISGGTNWKTLVNCGMQNTALVLKNLY